MGNPETAMQVCSSLRKRGKKRGMGRKGLRVKFSSRKFWTAYGKSLSQSHSSEESCMLPAGSASSVPLHSPRGCRQPAGSGPGCGLKGQLSLLSHSLAAGGGGTRFYGCHRLAHYFLIFCPSQIIL